jgi:Domain of unknown function (DUF4136)
MAKNNGIPRSIRCASTLLLCAALAAAVSAAKIKIKAEYDKQFDFKGVRTYAWHPSGAGKLKLLQATDDNAEALHATLDPIIVGAVEQGLAGRGLMKASGAPPDLNVSYYVLVGPNINAQTVGQFVGSLPVWGLPPFAPSTQSLEIYEQGTLILDIASAKADSVIWRGSANAEIDRQNSDEVRNGRIRDAVQDMLKKLPTKR